MSNNQVTIPEIPAELESTLYQLLSERSGIKEYDLMKALVDAGFSEFTPDLDPLAMFQSHFLLFHLLYRLQAKWLRNGQGSLSIHTLAIELTPASAISDQAWQNAQQALAVEDGVRDYYLDYAEFLSTQESDVIELIAGFWRDFGQGANTAMAVSETDLGTAKRQLDIQDTTESLTVTLVNRQYRKLSQRHHPDKGGEAEQFHAISEARECLLGYLARRAK